MSGSTTATLNAGTTYNMNVRGGSFITCLIGAWLDYNNNGTFEVSEFLGVSPNCGSALTVAFPAFTIPSGAVNGKMRLRLRSSDTSPGPSSGHSCGATNSGFGETEDYDVTITGGVDQYTYLWSNSATTQSTSVTPGSTTTYTVTVTGAGGCTATSSVTVTVNPLPTPVISGSNPLCAGGSVTLDAGAYTSYLWSTSATTQTISVNTAGTFTVTVTDANGCTGTASYTVTHPPVLTATCSGTNVSCNGGTNGSATATAGGGTSPYSYLWSNSATNATAMNLSAGTYTVTVTDANGCTATCSYTVTQPVVLTATCSGANVSCNGGSNGSASVSAAGGTSPYSYAWTGGSTDASITGLAVGTYTVTVTDANGCIATCSYTVTEPAVLTAMCSGTNVSCNGGSNGSASVTAGGGTSPYSYLWTNSATTATAMNLSAGTYTVTVTDANGCIATCSYTVTEPTALTLSTSHQNVNCFGGSNGSLTATAGGGTPVYSYLWNTGAATSTVTGLALGTYTVTVTDANGCTITGTAQVGSPPQLIGTITGTINVTCNGASTGSATLTASGGHLPYNTYMWSNGQTTATATGLAAGTYTATVTDHNGCTASASVTITQPASLAATCSGTNVTCNGFSDGSASVVAAGGTSPYSYAWSNGATMATAAGLATGTYTVTVTDNCGATASCSFTVTGPPALSVACSGTNVLCNGGSTGSASVTAADGIAPYTYAWSNGSTNASITGLAAGTYTVAVNDACGAIATCSYTVTEPAALTASCSGTNVLCNGGSTGSATVTAANGTSPYTYVWSNSATDASATGLSAGTYTVTVTDANGCIATCSYTVTEPTLLTATCSGTNVLCNGGSDGSATIAESGGTSPYTYAWSNGATMANATGLAAGTYTATVTDANGCMATCSYTVTEPVAITATCSGTNTACNGGSDGSASVVAANGTSPYTYSWSNGASAASATGLAAGTYTVMVTDANGCTATCSYTVTQPAALSATCSGTNVLCNGGSTGSASVTAADGTSPYTYAWSNGSTDASITGLSAGTYTATVTDGCGAIATCSYTVTEPAALTASCSGTNVLCNGGSTGSATVTAANGTSPYTYVWSNSATDASATGLSAGTYTATVTDANGCIATCSYTVTEPAILAATCSGVNVSCNGGSDGSASIAETGGTSPYTYAWSNGATGANATGLAAGTYTATVTDANGCTATCSYTVTEPAALPANCSGTNVSCNGGSDGSASVSATGGTAPYTYSWSNGATVASITGLAAGTYMATVTDANGCNATCEYIVTQPMVLVATCSGVNVSCNGANDGTASVVATGGTMAYTYLWSNGSTDANITGLLPGTYAATVTDANGCTATCEYTVTEPAVLTVSLTPTNVTCLGGSDGSIAANPAGGTMAYSYMWSNGQTTATATGLISGTYTVTVTDANGCTATASATITHTLAIPAMPGAITGPTLVCRNTTQSYSIAAVPGASTYTWTAPAGATVTGGQGNNQCNHLL
ncbi:MAG: SprB repeat-containing protein [Bacteroidetes bacterium]|nr:SprB repeat-containing protein [Bacteroidota bacterium]